MKILQISTPFLPIREDLKYGGTERVVFLLDQELNRLKHDVTVAAPKTSKPLGKLYPTIEVDIGVSDNFIEEKGKEDDSISLTRQINQTNLRLEHIARAVRFANSQDFDVVHIHDDNIVPFMPLINAPSLLTLHCYYSGEFWDSSLHPDITSLGVNLVAISKDQKKIYEKYGFKVRDVVYNGVDENKFSLSDEKNNFVFSLGIIHPRKGQREAIEAGKKSGLDVIIAGNIGIPSYFEKEIAPNITHDISNQKNKLESYLELPGESGGRVVYAGEVNDVQKKSLFSNARAFLMPITRPEPFGLVMVEAMLSGTPVIAYRCGSVPEIVADGKTGYIVENVDEMRKAIGEAGNLSSQECRDYAIKNFSKTRMAERYLEVYQELIDQKKFNQIVF
ncbi:MAG: glycosyltransferase family 4 protein [Candidatus Pacearchaeota archaeon]